MTAPYKKFAADVPRLARNGRIKCGTESNGGFKNITISNCVFEGCTGLALESEDGALCEDIAISNITMRDVVTAPLFSRLGARLRGPKDSNESRNAAAHSSSTIWSAMTPVRTSRSILSGIPDYAIQDLKISNVYIQQHRGGAAQDTLAIRPSEFENKYPDPGMFGPYALAGFLPAPHPQSRDEPRRDRSPLHPDPRPSFFLERCQPRRLHRRHRAHGQPAFHLNKVTDLRILMSRAAKDTQLATADDKTL